MAVNTDFSQNNSVPGPDAIALVESPQLALQTRLAMLREARWSLDVAYYATEQGISSRLFYTEIFYAAERGVKVRILLDGMTGPAGYENKAVMNRLQAHPNIEFRLYNRVRLLHPETWNCMLHDKMIIMDDRLLLMGGRNIGDRFLQPPGFDGEPVFDRDVLISRGSERPGSVLPKVAEYFEALWSSPASTPPKDRAMTDRAWREIVDQAENFARNYPAYFAQSTDDVLQAAVPTAGIDFIHNPIQLSRKEPVVARRLYELGRRANSIVIQTPYATANADLLAALAGLAGNADVTYLTNSPGGSPNLPAFSNYLSQRQKFLDTGIAIYEYQGAGSIHAKSMIFDNRHAAVGTLNLDDRSLFINTESMLIIDSPEFVRLLSGAIDDLLAQSLQVGPHNEYLERAGVEQRPVGAGKRVMLNVVSVFSRLFQFLI